MSVGYGTGSQQQHSARTANPLFTTSKFSLLLQQTRGPLYMLQCHFLKHVETVGEICNL